MESGKGRLYYSQNVIQPVFFVLRKLQAIKFYKNCLFYPSKPCFNTGIVHGSEQDRQIAAMGEAGVAEPDIYMDRQSGKF